MHYNKDVENQDMKLYCATNQFPELKFLGPHNKPHDVHGLVKHHHTFFDPKIGHGTDPIHRMLCACTLCTSIIEKPWIPGLLAPQQPFYQPNQDCTYWPV